MSGRTKTPREQAQYLASKAYHRVIGQALREGASTEVVAEYLRSKNDVKDPDTMIQIVLAQKLTPILGGGELMVYGGRDAFRALFGLAGTGEKDPSEDPSSLIHPKFRCTEAADAEFFSELFGASLRHDHRQSRWLIIDDETGLWLPDRTEEIMALAIRAMRDRQRLAVNMPDLTRDEREMAIDWTVKGESRTRLNNMLAIASTLVPIASAGDQWDLDPFLLGCQNGVVDLRTGTVRKAEPAELITMRCRVAFDHAATCPLWNQMLLGVFAPNEALTLEDGLLIAAFIQRALGYSITGDCREECCFFAYGEGANGKGTIMNTVGWLIGDYRDDMPYATLEKNIYSSQGIPNDIAKLAGKRYVTCAEVQEFSINESRLKALTGRDPMTARFLNQEFFTFEPVCKIWIATNNKPRITGQDDGIWRRIHLIPFTNKFEGVNKDDTIKDRLRLEGPGILNWLVCGTQLWLANGLNAPACVKAATEEYRLESDLLTPFIEQRCVLAPGAKVQASHAWAEYQNFSQMLDDRMSDKAFHKAMKKRFTFDAGRQTVYKGVGLLEGRTASGQAAEEPGKPSEGLGPSGKDLPF